MVNRVLAFLESEDSSLAQALEKFCCANCGVFCEEQTSKEEKSEGKRCEENSDEGNRSCMYKLEYTPLHQAYKELVEAHIHDFVQLEGYTIDEVFDALKLELGQDGSKLLRSLEATLNLDTFVTLMREVRTYGW
jgi:hypothetical protein